MNKGARERDVLTRLMILHFPSKYLPRSLTKYMTEKDEEQEDNLLECGLLAKTRLCGQGMFISSGSLNSLPSI